MLSKNHDTWKAAFCLAVLFTSLSIAISSAFASVIAEPIFGRELPSYLATDTLYSAGTNENDMGTPDMTAINHEHAHTSKKLQLQLALAKICVSESGFQVHSNDCTLIYHVLRRRSSTGEVTMGIMRAYAKKTFDENRSDSRRWIAHLNYDLSEPRGWAESVSVPWSRRQSGFAEVYNHTGMLLRTRPTETPCGVKVSHWGARGFRRELHLSQGWELVRCGNTHNDFWYVPNRRDAEERQVESDQEVASL